MTAQEALAWFKEELKDGKCSDNCRQCNAYEVAIEALETQIPEKPIIHGFREGREINTISYTCPNCGEHVSRERHCECGQALDWSDTE